MSTQKNNLKERLKNDYEEMMNARKYLQEILYVLGDVDKTTNLTDKIGIFVKEMPKFNRFEHQADWVKGILRKICTGELSPSAAYEILEHSYIQLIEVISCINRDKLFEYDYDNCSE